MSWNTPTDWTELDVFELSGGGVGGPGPGFPYGMFMNMHVFRRTGTDFTPGTVLSQPGNYFNSVPLVSRFYIYALDWDESQIIWLFNGRRVREMPNVYHQQALAVKVDSETMPNWFGLPAPSWRFQVFYVSYIRVWSRKAKATGRGLRDPNEATVEPAVGGAAISPYALQRAPMPGSTEVAGFAQPVPRAGWPSFAGRGPVPRSIAYIGPVRV